MISMVRDVPPCTATAAATDQLGAALQVVRVSLQLRFGTEAPSSWCTTYGTPSM